MRSGQSRANQNREIKKEELKLYLAERGRVQYIFDNIEKLEDLNQAMDSVEVQRIRTATDQRVKLLDKYMPSVKSEDADTGSTDNVVVFKWAKPNE